MNSNSVIRKSLESKSNFELLEIHNASYKHDMATIEALDIVIANRGGFKQVYKDVQIEIEKKHLSDELFDSITTMLNDGLPIEAIREKIAPSPDLTKEEVEACISKANLAFVEIQEDLKVTPKSISMGVIGGLVGGTLGGFLLGMEMLKDEGANRAIGIAVFACCFFFVWLFSRKSLNNKATVSITIGSIIYAFILSALILFLF